MQNCTEHFTPKLNQPCGCCRPWGHPQMGPAQSTWNILHLGNHIHQWNCWEVGRALPTGCSSLLCSNPPEALLSYQILLVLPLHFKGAFFTLSFDCSSAQKALKWTWVMAGKECLLIRVHKMKPPFVAQEEKQLEIISLCGQELPVLQTGTNKGHLELQKSKPGFKASSLVGTNHLMDVGWDPESHQESYLKWDCFFIFRLTIHPSQAPPELLMFEKWEFFIQKMSLHPLKNNNKLNKPVCRTGSKHSLSCSFPVGLSCVPSRDREKTLYFWREEGWKNQIALKWAQQSLITASASQAD